MTGRLSRPNETMDRRYDAVVIGSGYGAGVAASRLARCGRRVAVLERGREWLAGELPDRPTAAAKAMQITGATIAMGARTALFDLRLNEDVHVLSGCGLGGTSLINANVCLSPDRRIFEDPIWPRAVRDDGVLAEGFLRARHMLRPAIDERWHDLPKVAALAVAAKALGGTVGPVPVHVAFTAGANAAAVEQPACTRCGDCCGGCNVGAKTTVASTYIADAAAFGAQIFTQVLVRTVTRVAEGGWKVTFERIADDGGELETAAVFAAIVVLGAGTLGSTEILLRSRSAGLALSPKLGERFSCNGDAIAIAYNNVVPVNGVGVGHPPRADVPMVGAAVDGLIDLRGTADVEQGLAIVECALPSSLAALLPAWLVPGGALADAAEPGRLADGIDRLGRATESLIAGAYRGAVHNTQTFLAVGHDSAAGRIEFDGDRVGVHWPGAPQQAVYQRIEQALKTAAAATGGTYMRNPASERLLGGNLLTVHPLGGCAMGEHRAGGVVDHKGRVFDATDGAAADAVHEGLYVMDAAVIPRSLGVHPLLTITALAERAMMHLARDRGWQIDMHATRRAQPLPATAAMAKPKGLLRRLFGS